MIDIPGLTGAPIHTGAWGTPDIGVTETMQNVGNAINRLWGGNQAYNTAQGGSNLLYGAQPAMAEQQRLSALQTQYPSTNDIQTQQKAATGIQKGATTSTGGGGGGNNPQQVTQTNPSDIDRALGGINDYVNSLPGQHDTYINAAVSPFDSLRPGIDQTLQTGLNAANTSRTNAQQGYQDVLSSAKNLYDQLSRAYQQRFGGSNSAGAFGMGLLGQQFQQQLGTANGQLNQNYATIDQRVADLQSQHQAALDQLNYQVAAARSQAEKDFQDMLNQAKSYQGQAQANANLQALSQYQNQLNALQQIAAYKTNGVNSYFNNAYNSLNPTLTQNQNFATSAVPTTGYAQSQFSGIGGNVNPSATSAINPNAAYTGQVDYTKRQQ